MAIKLTRSIMMICLLGLLTACGGTETEGTSGSEGHGHSHE
ncbi:hypothetical protein EC913_12859 [Pseudomonas sp. LP_4_YM]|jgi:hypothetical protein|nr:hypothetical protein EC913_12859 [Pseudomonas sp. LP_4_YM]